MPELTPAQMRGIELNLEQQDRYNNFASHQRFNREPVDIIVREFYEKGRSAEFELMILNKIGLLLAPESTEDLNLIVRF